MLKKVNIKWNTTVNAELQICWAERAELAERADFETIQIWNQYGIGICMESESVRNRNLYGFGKHQKWLRLRYDCDFFRDLRSAYNSYKIAICAQFAIFDCRILWFARNLLRRYNLWVSHNLRFLTIFDYLQVCEIRKYDWLKKR